MPKEDALQKLARDNGFDVVTAGREELIAHLEALESLYRAHPAQEALEALHRYLFPERYAAVPMYEWTAETVEDVAERIERALPNAPGAREGDWSP
jgi:hypothetical protein